MWIVFVSPLARVVGCPRCRARGPVAVGSAGATPNDTAVEARRLWNERVEPRPG